MEPSEQLGDLLRQAGDADAALKCYRASGATTKVIEGKKQHLLSVAHGLSYCTNAAKHKC